MEDGKCCSTTAYLKPYHIITLNEFASIFTGKKTDEQRAPRDKKTYPIDEITHDIRDYLPLLHKERKSEHPAAVRTENLSTLRKLLRKL